LGKFGSVIPYHLSARSKSSTKSLPYDIAWWYPFNAHHQEVSVGSGSKRASHWLEPRVLQLFAREEALSL
jgi:hypothetical protein